MRAIHPNRDRQAAEQAAQDAILRAESYEAEGYPPAAAKHLAIGYALGRHGLTPEHAAKFERLIDAIQEEAPTFERQVSSDFPI